jgi:hypothetical protein
LLYILDVVIARLEVDLGQCQRRLRFDSIAHSEAYMFDGYRITSRELNRFVDHAERTTYYSVSVIGSRSLESNSRPLDILTTKLFQDMIL